MMNLDKHSISVVIPTYNGRELLGANLPSLQEALDKSGLEHEIIVSDDGSADGTIEFLAKEFPSVKTIAKAENTGFAPTVNRGIAQAAKCLVMLLNNDIKINEDYFAYQLKYFEKADTFGVMGRIIEYDDNTLQDAAKYPTCLFANIRGTVNYEVTGNADGEWLPTFMLSGANSLVNAAKLKAMGGYNEIYAPFNWEDMDLSLRAWRLGWRCYYEPKSVCRHKTSSTIGKHYGKRQTAVVSARNKMLLHYIHLDGTLLWLFFSRTAFKFLTAFLVLKYDFYKSLAGFIKLIPRANQTRRELKILGEKRRILLSVTEVCQNIKEQLKDRKIRKF
jgi:GT2 family glycosyltransferase